jgi:hypothetical protein
LKLNQTGGNVKKETEKLSYALEEAFDVIGVNRSAGYKLMADGKLETFKLGKRRFVTRKACEKCVELLVRESQGKAA